MSILTTKPSTETASFPARRHMKPQTWQCQLSPTANISLLSYSTMLLLYMSLLYPGLIAFLPSQQLPFSTLKAVESVIELLSTCTIKASLKQALQIAVSVDYMLLDQKNQLSKASALVRRKQTKFPVFFPSHLL